MSATPAGRARVHDVITLALVGTGDITPQHWNQAQQVLHALDRAGLLLLDPGSVTAVNGLAEADHVELLAKIGIPPHRQDPVPNAAKAHAALVLTRMREKAGLYA